MYVIRNQGFFFTDEYYSALDMFRQVSKKTYKTKAEAEKACAALIRDWVRKDPLGYYLFDDRAVIDSVMKYLKAEFPDEIDRWDYEVCIPEEATDKQVDEVVKRMKITFAKVFEVKGSTREDVADETDLEEFRFGPD